jgi:hypothetical protein
MGFKPSKKEGEKNGWKVPGREKFLGRRSCQHGKLAT